jgi:hypothetical protein
MTNTTNLVDAAKPIAAVIAEPDRVGDVQS